MVGHKHGLRPVSITFTEELSRGIFLIGFPREFNFEAGQVIGIATEEDGPRRLYSICSGEEESEIHILYKVIEEGYLTPRLSDLEAGNTLWITGPRGEFTDDGKPAVWIATGTGIAPFHSMLKSGKAEGKILIEGNRYLEQFHFFESFQEGLGPEYYRCSSAESSEEVFHGRVTSFLDKWDDFNPDIKYYLCGSAEMVVETRDLLIQKGIPFQQIISEIYF
jgi:ferredoxin/flavodoxin---NADP+ reductase